MKRTLLAVLFSLAAVYAQATIIQFDLQGAAGAGLLGGNEKPSAINPAGSGGEVGAGISFNDATLQLTLNVGWGSSQGFSDLTSNASNSHIHGPTASSGTAAFNETAGVVFNLTRSSNATTGGVFTTTSVTLTSGQAAELLAGRYYINVHTTNNVGGEIRGNLVQAIPEPGSAALCSLGAVIVGARRRR